MRNKFFISCVAAIIFILLLCTLVGSNVTNESTDRLEKAINESDNKNTTVINNYNNKYYDNSTTINNNIINSYNTDTDDNDIVSDNNELEEKTNDNEEVYETEETIADENDKEEYREYNDYNTENNSSNNNNDNNDVDNDNINYSSSNNTITPIGDIKNDMDPYPNIVHIKNIKCPNCGDYSYIEHYNLKDENLLFYMGTCNSCGFER